MTTKIKIKRDTAADWTSNDPTLDLGQIGYETDTGKLKIGDNTTAWTALGYFNLGLTQAEVDQLGNIGSNTISSTQWGYLGVLDQNLRTTDSVTHDKLTATTGVLFGSDTAAANTLDDYEEGTFTATLTAATPPTSPPTTTGYYTKIGDYIFINIVFEGVDTQGASGQSSITGLPYTSGNYSRFCGTCYTFGALSSSVGVVIDLGNVSSTILFLVGGTAAFLNIIAAASVTIRLSLIYKI